MYDTIRLRSDFLTEEVAQRIESQSVVRQGIDIKSGQLLYQITTSHLDGSYDNRISVRVKREMFVTSDGVYVSKHKTNQGMDRNQAITRDWRRPKKKSRPPVKIECDPYVIIEGSVHKAMAGHNVWGGPNRIHESCLFLVTLVEQLLDVELPNFLEFYAERVDVAECYELQNFDAVEEWFRAMKLADYGRREMDTHGKHGLSFVGKSTYVKFYHKGVEFKKHGDLKKLSKLWGTDPGSPVISIYERANRILRAEVEVKKDKFKYDFGYEPTVAELTDSYFNKIYDKEMSRILKESESSYETVRDNRAVQTRLFAVYSKRLANTLYGMWLQLATLGEDAVRSMTSKPTFYRNRKYLIDAGCSWLRNDLDAEKFGLIPEGFSPIRSDERRIREVLQEVAEKMGALSPVVDLYLEEHKKKTAQEQSS